jgi:hypothetical protein
MIIGNERAQIFMIVFGILIFFGGIAMLKDRKIGVAFFSIIPMAIFLYLGIHGLICLNQAKPLTKGIDKYISIPKEEHANNPYINGKVTIVDIDKREIANNILFSLPKRWIPVDTSEVKTIIQLKYTSVCYGSYSGLGGGSGYRTDCKVIIIDKEIMAIIYEGTFEGGSPPSYKCSSGNEHGSSPDEKIIPFLKALPDKYVCPKIDSVHKNESKWFEGTDFRKEKGK